MSMHYTRQILFLLFALALFATSIPLHAQVTTATLYGVVRDTSGAVLPGARVTATNQGTTFSRDVVADERGEFALPALPAGAYTVKIEMTGFKTYTNQGLQLGSGQNVRQTFTLEVGQLSENITVAETAPLVETASSAQLRSLGTTEWCRGRRNGYHRGRHRGELQPGRPRHVSVRGAESDRCHEHRGRGGGPGRQGRAAGRVRRSRRRPGEHDQPFRYERVPWLGVRKSSER